MRATVFESISLKGLRLAHLRQLQCYVHMVGEDEKTEWYYGDIEHFSARHKDLLEWIDRAVEYAESEGVKLPGIKKRDKGDS